MRSDISIEANPQGSTERRPGTHCVSVRKHVPVAMPSSREDELVVFERVSELNSAKRNIGLKQEEGSRGSGSSFVRKSVALPSGLQRLDGSARSKVAGDSSNQGQQEEGMTKTKQTLSYAKHCYPICRADLQLMHQQQ